jgi:WD40 repeat protein
MRYNLPVVASLCLIAAVSQASAQNLKERVTFQGHTFRVDRTALSLDGKILASGGGDTRGGELKLWDTVTGKEIASLPGYTNSLDALVFSPDGKTLASAGFSLVQVWDVSAHKQIHKFGNNKHLSINSLAYSPDGKKLGCASSNATCVWDLETGQELTSRKYQYSYAARALSCDLTTLAKGDFQDIDLFEIASGKLKATLSEHRGEVRVLAFSLNGKTLLASSSWYRDPNFKHHSDLKLWDVASKSERVSFKAPFGQITKAALSPDGKTIALLDSAEFRVIPDIKLIDVASGRQTLIRRLPTHAFMNLEFTRDGRLFVVGNSEEKTITLWQVELPN